MKRSVLLVTPYFAPQTHAAMFRVHKLSKYLSHYGWNPVVLTTDINYLYNEDPRLLNELPPEIEIHRARYIEPTLRGMRMALGGEIRTFANLKQKKHLAAASAGEQQRTSEKNGIIKRVYHHLLSRTAQHPDPYWTWRGPALRMARRLIREKNIGVIYTTSLPYTTLQIGSILKKTMGCKWVADLRDPGTYSQRMSSIVDSIYIRQRRIEKDALWYADCITVTSSAYQHIFEDLHGPGLFEKIRFIPTGLDESLMPSARDVQRGQLVFVGEYLPDYGNTFWRILRSALDTEKSLSNILKVTVIGHEQINRKRITPYLNQYNLINYISFQDHLSQEDLYRQLSTAHAGLLIPGPHSHWWTNFAKMVDYIALEKPVIALVPNPSEARKELSRVKLGIFLDGSIDEAARTLAKFLKKVNNLTNKDCDNSSYLANTQVKTFAQLFDLLSRNL